MKSALNRAYVQITMKSFHSRKIGEQFRNIARKSTQGKNLK